MWRNDTKCKYMFMFPLKNLARKGLTMMHDFATVGSNRSDLIKEWHSPIYPIMWSRLNHFCMVNSLVPKRCGSTFTRVYFKLILWIDILSIPSKIGLRWVPQNLADEKSPLAQVMAWCHQSTSHYLIQCWPRSIMPYGVTRLQWVKD